MQKINFQNLPSTTTPVNATNLNALQDNVEDVFDGDVPMGDIVVSSITSTTGIDNYSTNETRVGTWIDSNPIYRKVVVNEPTSSVGATNTVTNYGFPHDISNFGKLVNVRALIYDKTNTTYTYSLPNIGGQGNTLSYSTAITTVDINNINVRIVNDSWATNFTWVFVVEYTKTTD